MDSEDGLIGLPGALPGLLWQRDGFLWNGPVLARSANDRSEMRYGVLVDVVPDNPSQFWVWDYAMRTAVLYGWDEIVLPLARHGRIREAAFDHAVRWVAERAGLQSRPEAPRFYRTNSNPYEWLLSGPWRKNEKQSFLPHTFAFASEGRHHGGAMDLADELIVTPGIEAIDPGGKDPIADARALLRVARQLTPGWPGWPAAPDGT